MGLYSKKAMEKEVLNLLIALIIFVPLLLLFLHTCSTTVKLIIEKPQAGTEKSFERLVLEVGRIEEDEKIIPLYVDKNNKIIGYDRDLAKKPKGCDQNSCLCLCSNDLGCADKGIIKCKPLDEKIRFLGDFSVGPETNLLNYKLKKATTPQGKVISIEKAY
ncbi:MAG: hypothetical protein V1859_06080 [archaeon]